MLALWGPANWIQSSSIRSDPFVLVVHCLPYQFLVTVPIPALDPITYVASIEVRHLALRFDETQKEAFRWNCLGEASTSATKATITNWVTLATAHVGFVHFGAVVNACKSFVFAVVKTRRLISSWCNMQIPKMGLRLRQQRVVRWGWMGFGRLWGLGVGWRQKSWAEDWRNTKFP